MGDTWMLTARYRLTVRSGWWEHQLQVETLAAPAAWFDRYDSGGWDDPPSKLALVYELDRVASLLNERKQPFDPDRDRFTFAEYLIDLGCQRPPIQSQR